MLLLGGLNTKEQELKQKVLDRPVLFSQDQTLCSRSIIFPCPSHHMDRTTSFELTHQHYHPTVFGIGWAPWPQHSGSLCPSVDTFYTAPESHSEVMVRKLSCKGVRC